MSLWTARTEYSVHSRRLKLDEIRVYLQMLLTYQY